MCGEKFHRCDKLLRIRGSPPRVRGKALCYGDGLKTAGITPACAGKSLCKPLTSPVSQDHPRVCGEKPVSRSRRNSTAGSPPRVRGKVHSISKPKAPIRITPACAGKSVQGPDLLSPQKDHPRVCGEKTKKVLENSGLLIPCVSDFIEFLINPECGTTVLQGSVKPLRLYVKIVRQRL